MNNGKLTVMLTINKLIIGGAEQQLLELVKGIDKNRFNPIVVSLYPGGELEEEVRNIPGIEYICLNRKGKYNFLTLITILRLLRKKRVDVIQPFLTPATFFTLLPAILNRTKLKIITERASKRQIISKGYNIYLRTEDFFTRFADLVIPNSESGKNFLISRGIKPDQISVIYNGINTHRLAPDPADVKRIRDILGISEDMKVVGISASLVKLKDHDTFLRAAQIVSGSIPEVKYLILGEGPLRQNLEETARTLGIESKVIFTGNQTEVSPYLSLFDIACLSSKEPEGCSNSILEAMAMGKPVVATNMGGNVELVEDGKTGFIVPSQNPEAMANAILSILNNPEQREEMGRQGKERVSKVFSLERMVQNYEALYENNIEKKQAT